MDSPRRKAIHDAMVRLSDGDRSAMKPLVDELWPVLLAFARRGVGCEEEAEDVAQEVFLRICSRIAHFERDRDGLSWAFGIASYEILTHRRKQSRRRETPGGAELLARPDPVPSQEEAIIGRELAEALRQALATLSDSDRRSLMPADAVAFDLPSATLRKRRQRALERLRTVWRKLYGQP